MDNELLKNLETKTRGTLAQIEHYDKMSKYDKEQMSFNLSPKDRDSFIKAGKIRTNNLTLQKMELTTMLADPKTIQSLEAGVASNNKSALSIAEHLEKIEQKGGLKVSATDLKTFQWQNKTIPTGYHKDKEIWDKPLEWAADLAEKISPKIAKVIGKVAIKAAPGVGLALGVADIASANDNTDKALATASTAIGQIPVPIVTVPTIAVLETIRAIRPETPKHQNDNKHVKP